MVYVLLVVISLTVSLYSDKLQLRVILFFSSYIFLFVFFEYLDMFTDINIWSQKERTTECYDWFAHYLKKDYGIVNGKSQYDYTENIYHNDYTLSNEQSLLNKYELIFEELKLSKGKRLLDCGCGVGTWINYCKKRGVDVVGLTLSTEQQKINEQKGLITYVYDYRVLKKDFIQQFDAISLLGTCEHITVFSSFYNAEIDAYKAYVDLFELLRKYLKPNGKIIMTVLVRGIPDSECSSLYDRFQSYLMVRHYGGFYSTPSNIMKAIQENGLHIDSITDYTKDYHWISVAEPNHFGHWWVPWHEDTLDKFLYFFKGFCTDPFLIHHWLYYSMDTWMWQFGGYQKTPLTDTEVNHAIARLNYYVVSLPNT
jgi:cyclopropane fatty-acyl-phospholipid synthase-like methyltransferase